MSFSFKSKLSFMIIPPFLKPGDTVGVVAPASVVKYEDLLPGIEWMKEVWKVNVLEGQTIKSSYNQFSATDEDRLKDIQTMFDNPSVNAVIAGRGGYGCSRIVDQIDLTAFKKSPKWVVGFSDLTAIIATLLQHDFASLHAPMVKSMMQGGAEEARDDLQSVLFGDFPSYEVPTNPLNRNGHASGLLVGGNLCLLAHMIGSVTDVDTRNKILFIEDVNEYLYNLDRMMIQLKRAGKLQHLAGLVVGQFSDMRDNSFPTFGKNAFEIIAEHVADYDYPVCFDFPVGHVSDNRPMPVGLPANLKVSNQGAHLNFSKAL